MKDEKHFVRALNYCLQNRVVGTFQKRFFQDNECSAGIFPIEEDLVDHTI